MPAGSDHVIAAMNDITAVTSFDASERWLSRGCSVLLFVSAATTVTERDTGRLETPGCLRPRWAASSLGELAPNPPLNLVNSRSPLWFSSHSCLSSCSRFLLPEYLPYAGIFHERGQPGLATHSSVNRVLAGMRAQAHIYLKRRRLVSDLRQDTVTTKLFFFFKWRCGLPSVPSDAVSCPPQGRRSGTVSLQSPATSPTPRTACSGGTSPSLTFLRSAMVRQREAEGLSPLL